ncbi:MAG TPA: glycoside hydrolase family 2 protein [Micromonosporaceae bacterium]|nr:glycoside hydrolase family 2 protein [Micromonosporaceae bacterium]
MPHLRPLHDGWTVRAADAEPESAAPGEPVTAAVPGCVHTDLLAAGLIEDPYLDDNEMRLDWIGRTDWLYETTFDWAPDGEDRADLVCAGLDTVATVLLNGVEIGRTANMHRSYRFAVRELLREGGNHLAVRFASAYRYADSVREAVGERPAAYTEPYQYIRKMACNFGWDWGPTLVTAGIWQPIGLHTWSTARLDQVLPQVTVDRGTGRAEVVVTVERIDAAPLSVTATVAGATATVSLAPDQTTATIVVDVPDVGLWWPRGYGDAVRHELVVALLDGDGSTLDDWRRHVGFRSVRLDTTADPDGTSFTIVVNDTPVFVRGVNWIPDDAFVTRVDRARYADRLGQACGAGVNFLRVWGGGRYESEDFYDLADELGLLVGQDFLFACAAYPEEEPLGSEVAAEAREQVARLMPHPSLVLWVGNNENIWGWHDWDWQAGLAGKSWGLGYYLDVLPTIVAELDPTRPYWPGSPYSGDEHRHPNDPAHGSMHIWDVWNTDDYRRYRSYRPRFVAEFGFQAPPAFATLRRAVSDAPLAPDSPGVMHHQKAIDGNGKLARGLAGHFPVPHGFDDWHWATQLNQARAISFGIEHFRSLRPLCMGTILWQLNDNWPVTSWSAIDGDGRRKPLWYMLRRVYADRLVTIQPRDEGLALVAVNDGRTAWRTQFDVLRIDFTGRRKATFAVTIDLAPGESVTVALPAHLAEPDDPAGELLVADSDAGRAVWFFAEDVDLSYPAPGYDVRVEPDAGSVRVVITAGTLLRDLAIFPDRLDPAATVDEQLVTLLPGETAVFTVRSEQALDPAALTTIPVLRCANDLRPGAVDRAAAELTAAVAGE